MNKRKINSLKKRLLKLEKEHERRYDETAYYLNQYIGLCGFDNLEAKNDFSVEIYELENSTYMGTVDLQDFSKDVVDDYCHEIEAWIESVECEMEKLYERCSGYCY